MKMACDKRVPFSGLLFPVLSTELMRGIKSRLFFVALLLSLFVITFTPDIHGQEKKIEKGSNGCIGKEELISQLKAKQPIDGYVIIGDDVIHIIRETDLAINIKNSIIEGGLDFHKLPTTPLGKIRFPETWNDKEKEQWIKRKRLRQIEEIHIVTNNIKIRDTEILPIPSELHLAKGVPMTISARATLFFQSLNLGGTYNGTVNFQHTTFNRGGWFTAATFGGLASFNNATFRDDADFTRATFKNKAGFDGTTFSGYADFVNVNFSGYADFTGALFSGDVIFAAATFYGEASFRDTKFQEMSDFVSVTCHDNISFSLTIFKKEVSFSNFIFRKDADFSGAILEGLANFSYSSFEKLAGFNSSRFLDTVSFRSAVFKSYVDFRNTEIKRLDFNRAASPAIIGGRFDFRNAAISETHFQDIIFLKDVDFSDAKFGVAIMIKEPRDKNGRKTTISNTLAGDTHFTTDSAFVTVFRFVTFVGNAYFLRTTFSGMTSLERVNFQKEANFTDANFKGLKENCKSIFSFSYINVANLRIRLDQLPDPAFWVRKDETRIKSFIDFETEKKAKGQGRIPDFAVTGLEPLSQVMKSLEANFRGRNQLGDANQAYYHMKIAELQEAQKSKMFWQRLLMETEWIFWGMLCGYGTKIWWVLGWSLLVNLMFTLIYSIKGDLERRHHPETKQEFTFRLRLFDFPKQYVTQKGSSEIKLEAANGRNFAAQNDIDDNSTKRSSTEYKFARRFINALRLSLVILFKVGYRDTTISGKIGRVNLKYIVALEWALGLYLLAALTVTLANTQPLFHKLITGVF